ncbi:MAG: ATP-binding protein [Deltaproteobacteria bacterium]|nr:ATP-binding protein [Deltaproteobacteria bacterium]
MSRATGDAALAAEFEREGRERSWRGALIFCGFAAAMLVLSAVFSLAEPSSAMALLHIRAAALVAIGVIAWALTSGVGARRPCELAIALVVVMSLCLHGLAQHSGGQASTQYDRLTLVVLGLAILMSWNAGWSALACAAATGIYLGGTAAVGQLGAPQVPDHLGRLAIVALVAVGASAVRERQRWRQLVRVHQLTAAREGAEAQLRELNEQLERRVLERTAALRASEERFRAIFEAAPIGVITVDVGGAILQANHGFAAMLGTTADALLATPLGAWLDAEQRDGLYAALAELRDGRAAVRRSDVRYRTAGGAIIATHGALAALRDTQGEFLCALGMIEDVTERQRAETQARAHQERLTEVLRQTTVGGLLAELAHALNQPLGAIVNFANGTAARLRASGADAALVAAVAEIAGEGMRAAEIVRRVRDSVCTGSDPTDGVDLNALVRESAQRIASDAATAAIPVNLRLDPAVPPLTVDRAHLEQVLLNLLRNAMDAMRAAPRPDHALWLETVARADQAVEIRVRDTGIGVPREATQRIFDPFFTTKPAGLGLGLPVSRSIVEAHGGRLWATGNPDGGMTFAFTLPGADPAAATARPGAASR